MEKVMDTIAIIVPCYNEQEVLEQFHRRTEEVLAGIKDCRFRYVFVNDGSRDGTLPILRRLAEEDYKVSYISFSRNFGKEAAMLAEWIMRSAMRRSSWMRTCSIRRK